MIPLVIAGEMVLANTLDLVRLRWLECEGYFKPGYGAQATESTIRYLERIAYLAESGKLPGCPSRKPRVTES